MRALTVALDSLPILREATHLDIDIAAAATLAELAGVETVRLSINEDLKPVTELDLLETRRATRVLELQMLPSPKLVRVALEIHPDRIVLAEPGRDGRCPASPVNLRTESESVASAVRSLRDSGITVGALVAPDLESVKTAHLARLDFAELFTGDLLDLPSAERRVGLESLADASRLASKLGLKVGISGGLGFRTLVEVLALAPTIERVAVGRAALARAVLVGLDCALRDLRALVA